LVDVRLAHAGVDEDIVISSPKRVVGTTFMNPHGLDVRSQALGQLSDCLTVLCSFLSSLFLSELRINLNLSYPALAVYFGFVLELFLEQMSVDLIEFGSSSVEHLSHTLTFVIKVVEHTLHALWDYLHIRDKQRSVVYHHLGRACVLDNLQNSGMVAVSMRTVLIVTHVDSRTAISLRIDIAADFVRLGIIHPPDVARKGVHRFS